MLIFQLKVRFGFWFGKILDFEIQLQGYLGGCYRDRIFVDFFEFLEYVEGKYVFLMGVSIFVLEDFVKVFFL